MAGGMPEHAALAVGVSAAFLLALRAGPCRVRSSDLRVRVLATGLATSPDVTVVCGAYQSDPEDKHTITNPKVVVEITSESTNKYDRGEKLASYQQIAGLESVVIVSHRERLIEVFERTPSGGWARKEARTGQNVEIGSVGATLSVDEIYDSAQVH